MLIDRHVIVPAPDGLPWQLDRSGLDVEVPSTLTGVLQARLDLLSADEQDVVHRAAVVGRAFWDAAVAALFGQTDERVTERVGAALDRARSRELISLQPESSFAGSVEFAFAHALLRDVAYDMVLLRDRPRLHEFAADWLAGAAGERASEWASQIADHFRRSDDPGRAAPWYLMAGRHALDVYANEQAKSLLELAWDVSPADDQEHRTAALLLLDEVYDRLGDREAQRSVLDRADEAARKTGRLGDQVDVLLARSRLSFNLSDYDAARTHGSRAAAIAATAGLPHKETDALLWRAKSSTWTGDHERARNELHEVLEIARRSHYPAAEGAALRYLAVVAGNQSRFRESLDLLEQALTVHQAVNDVESASLVLAQLATTEYNLGHFESAQRHLEEVVPRFAFTGHRYRQAFGLSNLASIYNARGFLGRATEYGQAAMPMLRDIGDKEGLAVNVAHLALTARLVGRYDEAEERFRSSLDMARALRFHWLIADDLICLAMVCLETARCAEAHELLEQARHEAHLADSPLEEGKRLLACGYRALADAAYEDARDAFADAAELLTDIDNEELAEEARAGLSGSLLHLGDAPSAQRLAEAVFGTLNVDSTAACTTPPAVLLHIFTVLDATASTRVTEARRVCLSILSALEERIGDDDLVTEYRMNPWVAALVHELSGGVQTQ
jgi:tetratricopeptide (TPR) repeat protein